jgi:beta-lactamase regulating signal transducer with metallopeptidase domain
MVYLILSFNLVLAILVAIYWLFFRDGHAFRFNRHLLLALPLLALLLPQIPRPVEMVQRSVTDRVQEQIPFAANPFMEDEASAKNDTETAPAADDTAVTQFALPQWLQTLTWAKVLLSLYLAGVVLFFGRHLRQWWQLTQVLRRSERLPSSAYRLVRAPGIKEPFSFFQWIVLPKQEYRYTDYQQILEHELVHVRQRHSWDIMLGEWLQILCWFNPAVKSYRSLVRNNLEYLVDDTLLHQGVDQRTYQYSLLSVSLGGQAMSMATNYNHSFIKKRIQMMNTTKIKRMPFWKGGLILLQVLAILQLFGQGLPPITKGMHIILIGDGATPDELFAVRQEIEEVSDDISFDVSNVNYNPDGSFQSIAMEIDMPKASGSNDYSQGETPGLPYTPLFAGLRGDGQVSSLGTLDPDKLDKIIELYDDLHIHTAGLDGSKAHLQAIRPQIEELNTVRKAFMNERRKNEGSPFSTSMTFTVSEDQAASTEYSEGMIQLISTRLAGASFPVTYYLDGVPSDISVDDLDFTNVKKIEIRTEGVTKDVDGKEVKEGEVKVLITRKPGTSRN